MRLGVEAALVDGVLVPGDVSIDGERISAVGLERNGGQGIAVPGFVDLQVNGFGGVDFATADADGYRRAGESLLETGVIDTSTKALSSESGLQARPTVKAPSLRANVTPPST